MSGLPAIHDKCVDQLRYRLTPFFLQGAARCVFPFAF